MSLRPSTMRASAPSEAAPEGLTGVPLLRRVATYPVARYDTKAYRAVVEACNVAVNTFDGEPDRLRAAYRAGLRRAARLLWERARATCDETLRRDLDHALQVLRGELDAAGAPFTPEVQEPPEREAVRRLLDTRDRA